MNQICEGWFEKVNIFKAMLCFLVTYKWEKFCSRAIYHCSS